MQNMPSVGIHWLKAKRFAQRLKSLSRASIDDGPCKVNIIIIIKYISNHNGEALVVIQYIYIRWLIVYKNNRYRFLCFRSINLH